MFPVGPILVPAVSPGDRPGHPLLQADSPWRLELLDFIRLTLRRPSLARSVLFSLAMMCRRREEKKAGGFTLTEVLVALLVAAVIGALALPSLGSFPVTSAANAEARRLYSVFRTARWKAIRAGARTRVLTWPAGDSGGISYGLQEKEGSGWTFVGEVRHTSPGLHVVVTGPAAKVFTPRGSCSFGSVSITGRSGVPYRLSLNPATGRVRLRRGETDVHEEG